MLNRSILVLGICLILIQTHASELECAATDLHLTKDKKSVVLKEKICFDEKKRSVISGDCYRGTKCDILLKANTGKQKKLKTYFGPIGSPDIKLCHQVGGIPQIGTFSWKNKLEPVSLCRSEQDNSYVDTETLYRMIISK